MNDLNGHGPDCIRHMYRDAGVRIHCECGDTDCLVQDRHNTPANVLRDEDCGEIATTHLVSVENGARLPFCEGCAANALQSGRWATGEDVAAALRADAGINLEGDAEKDEGDGGLGTGRWLERDQ